MSDPGQRIADASFDEIKTRLTRIYEAASRDIIDRLDKHQRRLIVEDAKKRRLLKAGRLSEDAYQTWLEHQVYRGKNWEMQVKDLTDTLLDVNRQALRVIEGKRLEVFEENLNYQAYRFEGDFRGGVSFTLYDHAAVTRLIREQPALLPVKDLDRRKDAAWQRKIISSEVARGILAGSDIPTISRNMAEKLGRDNDASMTRWARTAMTGAQNAGRIERMHEAQDMGIRVMKVWIAVLDSRTRDAHAELDGVTIPVDMKFHNSAGYINYPGDPMASAENTWDCRCTLGYDYGGYKNEYTTRYDNESGEAIDWMTYDEWKEGHW